MSVTLELPTQPIAARRAAARNGTQVLLLANCLAIAAVAIWLRCWKLDHVPGVNGDEAWYGVEAVSMLRGGGLAWRTPTGNVLNPFFLGPLVALHALFPPSFALLRSVAVGSGLMALVLNFWLCRRAFDLRTATISTLLLAVLPLNIAYCRFAWDASQSLAATVLAMYLPLLAMREPLRRRRWLLLGALALAVAVLIHPTNMFAAPFLAAAAGFAFRAELARAWLSLSSTRRRAAWFSLGLASGCGAWLLGPRLVTAALRIVDLGQAREFVLNYCRLLSGATVFRFIPGAIGGTGVDAWDVVSLGLGAVALFGFYQFVRDKRSRLDRCLAIGWLGSLLAFYLFAGPAALEPHFERYGVCLIAPAALVLSRGACWYLSAARERRRWIEFGLVALAGSLLVSFYANYFWFFERTGGLSHRTFQTGPAEPKAAALECILNGRDAGEPVRIVTSEWWNYWPLAYLASAHENVVVVRSDGAAAADNDRAWYVEFSGSVADNDVAAELERQHIHGRETQFCDYAGRPVITVHEPNRKNLRNY